MKCPACENTLSHIDVDGVEVDICQGGCGGVWFDTYEFKKFDEPHESAGAAILDVERDQSIKVDSAQKRACPRCDNIIMMKHFFSVNKHVEIDECAGCAGVWLDPGELSAIRSLYNSEEERRAAASQVFSELFDCKIEDEIQDSQQKVQTARRIANVLKFICPSYYLGAL